MFEPLFRVWGRSCFGYGKENDSYSVPEDSIVEPTMEIHPSEANMKVI